MNGDYKNDQQSGQDQGQYNGNNQSNFYREQGYGPQGYNQQNPYWNSNQNQQADAVGNTAQTFGIVAIVASFFCAIVGLIFGILAISRAKESLMIMQYETPAAKTGRVCGIVAVIFAAVSMVSSVIGTILLSAAYM